jgi:hypothetical protein
VRQTACGLLERELTRASEECIGKLCFGDVPSQNGLGTDCTRRVGPDIVALWLPSAVCTAKASMMYINFTTRGAAQQALLVRSPGALSPSHDIK